MEPTGVKRKLAVILAADVEGYSRLMGADEEAERRTLNAYREVSSSAVTSKRLQGVRAAVLALLLSVGIATAATAAPGDIQYIQGKTASVHQDPSKSAPVLIRLNRGHKVMEVERQGSWVRIQMFHTTRKGWVRSSLLAPRFPGETAAAPASPKPTPEDIRPVEFLLAIRGSPARKFVARCRIITETGDEILAKMSGTVPKLYKIEAKAVRCSVGHPFNRHTRLRVKLTAGDQVFKSFIRRTKKLGRVFRRAIVYSPWDWD